MSKNLVAASEIEVAKQTAELLCAVKFLKNRKRNFESVLLLAKKADLFIENDGQFLVGFMRSKSSAKLAMAFLEELRIASWDYMLFANGRVVRKVNQLRNVLDCYNTAVTMKDTSKYCHKVFDAPMEHFTARGVFEFSLDDLGERKPEKTAWRLPCQHLEGHLNYTSEDELADPTSHMRDVADVRMISSCPLFDLSSFEVMEKIAKSKHYW